MDIELIDKLGSDLSVVNAARVSFAKRKDVLDEKDDKLIKYLAKWGHWSPFAHAFLSFRIKAPIFVARQLVKHQVGLSWNEVSRRYVSDKPEFYIPFMWRKKPEKSIKQGSSDEEIEYDITHLINVAKETYNDMRIITEFKSLNYLNFFYCNLIEKNKQNCKEPNKFQIFIPKNKKSTFVLRHLKKINVESENDFINMIVN